MVFTSYGGKGSARRAEQGRCFLLLGEDCFFGYCAFGSQGFRLCGGDKGAMETDEVRDRPLDPFGAFTPMLLNFYRYRGNGVIHA